MNLPLPLTLRERSPCVTGCDETSHADHVWHALRAEAVAVRLEEPCLREYLATRILDEESLETALARSLAVQLAIPAVDPPQLHEICTQALSDAAIAVRRDLEAIPARDPVARGYLLPFLSFKGFQALQAYRVAHWLWQSRRHCLAVLLQNRIATIFGVDIHPAAKLGSGILMDHATGIVIGETSLVENDVSLLHSVTLGGTGKESGDRHPKVRAGVLIGAGAKLLGNIEIGTGAKVGAGSVVLDSVPPHCTVAGVPARIVARATSNIPALDMDQSFPHSFEGGSGI